jgi:hypothetical protein
VRAVIWLVMMTFIGSTWFAVQPQPNEMNADDNGLWNPVLVSMDLALPIVDLGQDGLWLFDGASQWVAGGLSVLGWLTLGAILACLPRTLQRR